MYPPKFSPQWYAIRNAAANNNNNDKKTDKPVDPFGGFMGGEWHS